MKFESTSLSLVDDHNRVLLKETASATGSDYINASYIVSLFSCYMFLFSCFSVSYNKGRHGFAHRKAHHFSAISLFLNIWFRVWIQESLFICWLCWSGHSVVFLGKTLYFHSTSFLGIEPTNYQKKLNQGNKWLALKCQGNLSKG